MGGACRRYANQRGVRIIGDIPIFVAYDSADVWANPDLFFLDASGQPTVVAGVPPDYFSATGQLWGNPLYRWDVMAERGYDWWIARLRMAFTQVDVLRIDHFIGIRRYWEVPGRGQDRGEGPLPGPVPARRSCGPRATRSATCRSSPRTSARSRRRSRRCATSSSCPA